MPSSSNGTYRGQNPENYIAAAKRAAKTALRKRNPKLTALERGFYIKYKAELDAARSTLIQIKKPRKNQKQAA